MHTTIGTCSNCGGEVTIPSVYHSVVPPKPTCQRCGAVARPHGPVIDMEPPPAPKGSTLSTLIDHIDRYNAAH